MKMLVKMIQTCEILLTVEKIMIDDHGLKGEDFYRHG